ncbi:2,3-bisphosphoglycerate-independent phosphoglycerate mutase [Herbidospora mongoliensis]|uniref:2,3-bisphosphoglycerate-independent phosphoglycerate mutase n=1 Tax=Herbidospora mongoliensis TaxID=688067 RepID=UPI0008317E06|nr:2,3-bisphosphoglycerate-independent phosphoglycerate mutase [Herbidospora mongoliensis]
MNGILLVLDGWGHAPQAEGNALTSAVTPFLDELTSSPAATLVGASGEAVGLLPGTVGNSEIGHMVIGAGRPLPYDSVLVQQAIDSGALAAHPLLSEVGARLASSGGALHLIGLCSDGQIHAHVDHLRELLTIADAHLVPAVWIHAITDGRDVADGTAAAYLDRVEKFAAEAGIGRVATVVGRGYALDKSGDLELTRAAMTAIADGTGKLVQQARDALADGGVSDEWTPPSVVADPDGNPLGAVRQGDAVLFTNFRSDRIQQLADQLVSHLTSRDVTVLSLARYDTAAEIPPLVDRADASDGLADELERHGLRSVRVAEREKFEHVTYYINGRDSRARDVEEHVRIVADTAPDYRARPQMNLAAVTAAVTDAARRADVHLVVANLANIDVVGHTGDSAATVRAAEHTDDAVARICQVARETERWVLLVGDHGNAEQMLRAGPDGRPRPYGGHTTNPVPLVLLHPSWAPDLRGDGTLADVAPTVLALLGHPPGEVMTGRPIFDQPPAQAVDSALLDLVNHQAEESGVVANPRTRATFSPDSTVESVNVGSGLKALLRTSTDGAEQLLCVYNDSLDERSFTPAHHLRHRPLLFVHGATATEPGTIFRLNPGAHVWIGSFTSSHEENAP